MLRGSHFYVEYALQYDSDTLIFMFHVVGKLYLVFEYVDKNLLEVLEDQPQGE